MVQSIAVTPIVGLPQFSGWSHVISVVTETNISCVIAIAISGDSAANIGKDVASAVMADQPRSAEALYQWFEDTVIQLTELGCDCSLAGGVFRPGRSIIATYQGSVLLKRGTKIAPVLESAASIEIIQGRAQLDDVYIFSTVQARQFLSAVSLTYAKGFDTDSVVTSVVPALHSLENSALCSLAFAAVEEKSESEIQAMAKAQVLTQAELLGELNADRQNQRIQQEQQSSASDTTQTTDSFEHEVVAQQARATDKIDRELDSQGDVELDQEQVLDEPKEKAAEPTKSSWTSDVVVSDMSHVTGAVKKRSQINWKKIFTIFVSIAKKSFSLSLLLIVKLGQVAKTSIQWSKKIIFSRDYLESDQVKRTRKLLIIGILGIVIVLGVWFVVDWQRSRAESAAAAIIEPYQARIEPIRSQAEDNPLAARDQAQTFLTELEELRFTAQENNNSRLLSKTEDLYVDAQQLVSDISGREELTDLAVAFDLRSIRSDFIATLAAANGNSALLIDREAQVGLLLDLNTGEANELDLTDIPQVQSLSIQSEDTAILLAGGLYSLTLEASAQPIEIKAEGDSNRAGTLVGTFASYVYVFNPERRNIYRYVSENDEYSDPIGWLVGPLGISFDEISSWAIDGDIWIATQDGRIRKYSSGQQADFSPQGLREQFSGRLTMVTNIDVANLYVLEPSQQRVVILSKEGQFLREIKNVSLAAATELLVNESAGRAYVVSGSTIFSINL